MCKINNVLTKWFVPRKWETSACDDHILCACFLLIFFFTHYYSWCSITKKQCASFFIVSVIACREKGRIFVKCWKFYVFFLLVCYGTCLQLLLVHIKAATRVNTAKEKQLKTKSATMCVDMWSRRKHWHLTPHVCAVVERLRWNLLPALGKLGASGMEWNRGKSAAWNLFPT